MMHFGKQAATQTKCNGVDEKLILRPYSKGCGGETPHHLIPDRCAKGKTGYSRGAAPCICVEGTTQYKEKHRDCHEIFDPFERVEAEKNNGTISYSKARDTAALSAGGAFEPPRPLTSDELECVKLQLDEYYKKAQPEGPGLSDSDNLNATANASGKVNEQYEAVKLSGGVAPLPQ